ncbi:MAG: hypothetical protein J0I12_13085 [Candidatus Eremiobacteraeota bacterium]|mgnify:CR=1 FL=1|nr:hypothetical protein [Candidatus Eremiobacteraeota bacterium]
MGLVQAAEARKLAFPLLGIEASVPDAYTIDEAAPARVILSRKNNPVGLSFYRVEFGNLDKFTPAHNRELEKFLRQRLGKGARVELSSQNLAGRPATRVLVTGLRGGKPWQMLAAWSFRGGQAQVVEVLYPVAQRNEAGDLFAQICRQLVWTRPERG